MERIRLILSAVLLVGLAAGPALATTPAAIDGTVPPGEAGYSSAGVQVQSLQTQFGDNSNPLPDQNSGGSELDNLSIADDATYLWIALGGSMEINGNKVAIMIDVDNNKTTGASTLPADGYGTFNGEQLPVGVELIVTPNAGGPNQTLYLNAYCYSAAGANTYTNYLGSIAANPGNPTTGTITNTILGNPYTLPMALNNANTAGVGGGNLAHTPPPDPALVSTGLEIGIPRALLAQLKGSPLVAGNQVGIYVGIGSGGSPISWSNQFLPALTFTPPVNNQATAPNLSTQPYVAYTLLEPVVPPPTTIGWCNLQWPPTTTTTAGTPTATIYGQVWVDGVTNSAGQGAGIVAELGWGNPAVDPTTWTNWSTAAYNTDAGNNDEYQATLTISTPGTYGYVYRFSINSGPYAYGDLDGSSNGLQTNQLGQLTVNPATAVGQWPLY